MSTKSYIALATASLIGLSAGTVSADVVGKVGVDWIGNDIIIDAVADPQVKGVTCHVTYFDRSVIDRVKNGNWFEDPSNNSIACRQTGPIEIGDIDLSKGGDEVFKTGMSLIWKKLVVNRIYDKENDTLIYLAHSRELTDGSAKMAISTIPLYGQNVLWKNGKPQ
ncbi:CreA protein [Rhizobium tibeticum]|uniref:CreA protein n=2 Tax=Rhizobium TaxID=379 RepID=A0A1H8SNZ0_9HYPH|nr:MULTISPECIES: CreA family protein [Rhizobium]MCA0802395.1 CreA family protein [Rhizobium sp. T1473]MCS0457693.1 CreA family protein [Rhizobium favelukesii]MDP9809610.1 CreA protein [Rhizobium tibeticum]UFS83987.1 CreA family protein [Rhizobium sp. T136]CDM58370.1 Protein creA [Rhizobium favelukesii]